MAGRGELQLAVLIETLRREGYEFSVSRPEIIKRTVDGKPCEPVEDVVAEVPEAFTGVVMEKLSARKGRMVQMESRGDRVRLSFVAPSRGLFGYRSEFLSDTRGDGVLHRTVRGWEPWAGDLPTRGFRRHRCNRGGQGHSRTASSTSRSARRSSSAPRTPVYEGMIFGENRRAGDMNVNAVRAKKLTNVRAAGKDEAAILSPPRKVAIEWALEWLAEDELLEVTPGRPAPAQARPGLERS